MYCRLRVLLNCSRVVIHDEWLCFAVFASTHCWLNPGRSYASTFLLSVSEMNPFWHWLITLSELCVPRLRTGPHRSREWNRSRMFHLLHAADSAETEQSWNSGDVLFVLTVCYNSMVVHCYADNICVCALHRVFNSSLNVLCWRGLKQHFLFFLHKVD